MSALETYSAASLNRPGKVALKSTVWRSGRISLEMAFSWSCYYQRERKAGVRCVVRCAAAAKTQQITHQQARHCTPCKQTPHTNPAILAGNHTDNRMLEALHRGNIGVPGSPS
jgi:hypothetical protein